MITEVKVNNYPDELLDPKYCHLVVARAFTSDHETYTDKKTGVTSGVPVEAGESADWAWGYDKKRIRAMIRSGALALVEGPVPQGKASKSEKEAVALEAAGLANAGVAPKKGKRGK